MNNVKIDEEYVSSIQDGITNRPYKLEFVDTDADGHEDEVIISSQIATIGERTPVYMNAKLDLIFEIKGDELQYKEAVWAESATVRIAEKCT